MVLVPDDEVDDKGNLSRDKIILKYRNQKWDCSKALCNNCSNKSICCYCL